MDGMKVDNAGMQVPVNQGNPRAENVNSSDAEAFSRAMNEKQNPGEVREKVSERQESLQDKALKSLETARQRPEEPVQEKKQGERQPGEKNLGGEQKQNLEHMPSGQELFSSLFGQQMKGMEAASVVAAPAEAAASDLGEIMDKLVDRILVSEPKGGMQEVRISLNDGALPGTEVRLSRGADGMLSVQLSCTDPSTFQTLVSSQDALKSMLQAHGNNVRVEVSQENEQAGGQNNQSGQGGERGNDAQQQSRGYWQYQQPE